MSQDKYSSGTSKNVVFHTTTSPKIEIKTNPQDFDVLNPDAEYKLSSTQADPWIHRSDNMQCKTCMWFVEKAKASPLSYPGAPVLGRCRRHAPSMNGYPVVFNSDWCGDHKVDENKI